MPRAPGSVCDPTEYFSVNIHFTSQTASNMSEICQIVFDSFILFLVRALRLSVKSNYFSLTIFNYKNTFILLTLR